MRRKLALLLCLALCLALFPVSALAADNDFTINSEGILIKYKGPGGSVVIPDGITAIQSDVFRNNAAVTSVIIPDSVTSIGSRAFLNCVNLRSVTIPSGLTDIGSYAFLDTPWQKSLGEFAVVNGVVIGYNGPGGDVVIPFGPTAIGQSAFHGCASLTGVTIPASVTRIEYCAFEACGNLASVTIPASVTSIEGLAFSATPWLESLGKYAVVNGILIHYNIFSVYGSAGRDAVIPAGVTSIGDSAFSGCGSSLYSVTIPSSVTRIGKAAFTACTSLTSMSIPNSVTEIGDSAFSGCWKLADVTIPNCVTSIGESAFSGCPGLTDVYFDGSEAQWKEIGIGRLNENLTDATIHFSGEAPTPGTDTPVPTVTTFTDVPAGAYYAEGVSWAVENGVTRGTGDGMFSPEVTCSHVEIITFLWRANGSPKVSAAAPISVASWFTDAVNWAYSEGIISEGFQPDAECTRAFTVVYMWQAAGRPEVQPANSFTDVPDSSWYAQPVAWAVANAVTSGTSATTFDPSQTCTRGQIVTFLYRAYRN